MQHSGPAVDSLSYSARCRQVRALGGDFYDFMPLPHDGLALAVGDASGKGLAAALMIANVQSSVRNGVFDKAQAAVSERRPQSPDGDSTGRFDHLARVALKVVVPLTGTVAAAWERVADIVEGDAAVIVIVAVADLVPSAIEVAPSVTFARLGTAAGAVYITIAPEAPEFAERVPHVAPLHPAPVSSHP